MKRKKVSYLTIAIVILTIVNMFYFYWLYVNSRWLFKNKPMKHISFKEKHFSDINVLYSNDKFIRLGRMANISADSKNMIDRATKKSLEVVLDALNNVNESNLTDVQSFINDYLHEPGFELVKANFTDWKPTPKFIHSLKSNELKQYSKAINDIWLDLYKMFDIDRLSNGSVSSHLPMKHPFIVPGGRFNEMYYWDTYWIINGLLVCDMHKTVRLLIENFIEFIDKYGFVPNGSRIYYLNRSQPPYFAHMVLAYYEYCMKSNEISEFERIECVNFVLDEALTYIIKEYTFWMTNRTQIVYHDGKELVLNLYKVSSTIPRPEGYFKDLDLAKILTNDNEREILFANIASGAESGLDFSSRWFGDQKNMVTIETSNIIPIDLNALLYKTELIIVKLCEHTNNERCVSIFIDYANRRKDAINTLLWSTGKKCWCDYNIKDKRLKDDNFYITNLSPLWFDMTPPDTSLKVLDIIKSHLNILTEYNGGIPFSLVNCGQQWDFPNGWPPHHHSLITFIYKHNFTLSLHIAKRFFNSTYSGWINNGIIFEKYNVIIPGQRGNGGEYEVQSGFGWTNGVILSFINLFKDKLVQ